MLPQPKEKETVEFPDDDAAARKRNQESQIEFNYELLKDYGAKREDFSFNEDGEIQIAKEFSGVNKHHTAGPLGEGQSVYNTEDQTVDDSWNTLKSLLLLDSTVNPNEIRFWDDLKEMTGNDAFIQFVHGKKGTPSSHATYDSEGNMTGLAAGSYGRFRNTPDTMRVNLQELDDGTYDQALMTLGAIGESAHGREFTKSGTLDSYNPYADSLKQVFQDDRKKLPNLADRYAIPVESHPNKFVSRFPSQYRKQMYKDPETGELKNYEKGVTKRGETPEEFWTHSVLQEEMDEAFFKAKILDALEAASVSSRVENIPWNLNDEVDIAR